MKAWALCKALHNMLLECKSNQNVCAEVVHLVLEYTHTHTHISAITFGLRLFPIHEYLEDCVYDCSLAILQSLSSPSHAWCWTITVMKAAEFNELQFWSVPLTIVNQSERRAVQAETVRRQWRTSDHRLLRKHSAHYVTTTAESECSYVHGVPLCGTSLSSIILFSTLIIL